MGEEHSWGKTLGGESSSLGAEGQTEETFIKRVIAPHVSQFAVMVVPTVIATKRLKSGGHFKGDVPSYTRVKREIQRLLGDT